MFKIKNNEKRKKESSLVQRKSERQAIFKFVLSSASGGTGGGKYNRIPAFVSMSVLLIGRSLEKFFQKNFRDDSSFFDWILRFVCTPLRMTIPVLAVLLSLNISTAWADNCSCSLDGANNTLTITDCPNGVLPDTSCANQIINDKFRMTDCNVIIGTGVTSIGEGAFANAFGLTSITIPEGVTSIGNEAFMFAFGLTSITIPDSVTSIGDFAFDGSDLTSITIPDSVTSIGDFAFDDSVLTNIMCKGDKTSCAGTVAKIRDAGYTGNISYPTDKASCEGADISLYVWDGSKCGRRNEEQCNSVAKYYYSDGKCQVLPKTQSACTGANIEWNATDKKCVNKNYTPSQESSEFSEADCYNKGQVPYNNQCWDEYPFAKKRWTPAEAAQWLHDGNDNFVVLTFKK